MECFLKKFLASELRQQPTELIEANMWLIKYVEELPHRGAKRAEPRPAMCTVYQAGALTPSSQHTLPNDFSHVHSVPGWRTLSSPPAYPLSTLKPQFTAALWSMVLHAAPYFAHMCSLRQLAHI